MTLDKEMRMRHLMAALSDHDIEKVLSSVTDDVFYEEVTAGGAICRGKEELRFRLQNLFAAFPDLQAKMTSYCASGDFECLERISSGTHKGDIPGLPATGKRFSIRQVVITNLKEDKISRISVYSDSASLLQQLGALPSSD